MNKWLIFKQLKTICFCPRSKEMNQRNVYMHDPFFWGRTIQVCWTTRGRTTAGRDECETHLTPNIFIQWFRSEALYLCPRFLRAQWPWGLLLFSFEIIFSGTLLQVLRPCLSMRARDEPAETPLAPAAWVYANKTSLCRQTCITCHKLWEIQHRLARATVYHISMCHIFAIHNISPRIIATIVLEHNMHKGHLYFALWRHRSDSDIIDPKSAD